jgi:peptidoglycan/xylan/chitin deacetylase (PgdA/CDA1 family)
VASAVVLALVIGGFAVVWLLGRDRRGGRPAAQPSTAVVVAAPKSGRRSPATELARLAALGRPVYCGSTDRREFALTFDDGPGPYTPLALRIIRRAGVPATFFDVGKVIIRWPTQLPRELHAGALGEHTWTHPYLPSLPPTEVEHELTRTKQLIESITHRPVRLFRPPYGALSQTVQTEVRRLHNARKPGPDPPRAEVRHPAAPRSAGTATRVGPAASRRQPAIAEPAARWSARVPGGGAFPQIGLNCGAMLFAATRGGAVR